MTEKHTLPSFKKPPVTEVVLGIQFNTISNFKSTHFGLYHQCIKNQYPKVEEQPPLPETFEFFEKRLSVPQLQYVNIPPLRRCWFIEEEGTRLVQLQPEHFLYNWRKVSGDEVYPRYESIREEFEKLWKGFLAFTKDQSLEPINVNHWEVTYVNHIDKGKGWESLADLKNIVGFWSDELSLGYLPKPEKVDLNMTYAYPLEKGRLHVSLKPAIRQRDKVECLLLRLTARGQINSFVTDEILKKFDSGREWIVRGFTDLTKQAAHKTWIREA
jgi:uncharacterized protein (TIGR04255 family)